MMGIDNDVLVSVIIPIYNGEKYLNICLDSVIGQSLVEIEIICVNDGSTDGTNAILNEYKNKDDRIRVITKENSGYGHSMNIGIAYARGLYIGIVEADDYVPVEMFERLYNYAIERDADVVKANYYWLLGEGNTERKYERSILPKDKIDLYNKSLNYHSCKEVFSSGVVSWAGIYKNCFLNKNNIRHNESPGAAFQDNGFWFQIMVCAQSIYFIQDHLYVLRRNNSDSSVFSCNKEDAIRSEYDFIYKWLISKGDDLNTLLPIYWRKRLTVSTGDIGRVSYNKQLSCVQSVSMDIEEGIRRGEINRDDYSEEEWSKYNMIHIHPEQFFNENLAVSIDARKKISDAPYIVLYGAKNKSHDLIWSLRSLGLEDKILAVVVSDLKGNPELVNYIPVMLFVPEKYSPDTLFIISTQKHYYSEIREMLSAHGFYNIIHVDDIRIR